VSFHAFVPIHSLLETEMILLSSFFPLPSSLYLVCIIVCVCRADAAKLEKKLREEALRSLKHK
jgi:hypothetical protein